MLVLATIRYICSGKSCACYGPAKSEVGGVHFASTYSGAQPIPSCGRAVCLHPFCWWRQDAPVLSETPLLIGACRGFRI
ncbi:hypothetical protein GDO78_009608 [Eleutherodactylus coqui]|uniref:Uncharacterized protein n=1 Tax=Eleutherodactylus coqui TaxID=57060 RepID=A0A8J6FAK5_ELECQ|nr:hypothetical protein GDO78_009608 [Eleutherodactylus coqui]